MTSYVEIAVNVPRVSGVFHYHLPAELEGKLRPGHLVLAPFGKQVVQGVVLRPVEQPQVPETKGVRSLLDERPALTPLQLQLAEHMAETTLAPLAACVGLMLPPGLGQVADVRYSLAETGDGDAARPTAAQRRILDLLKARGPLTGRQLDRALPRRNWRSSMAALGKKGRVESEPVPPLPRVRPKTVRTAQLIVPPAQLDGVEEKVGQNEATRTRRSAMLRALALEAGPVDASRLYAESGGNLQDLYRLEELDMIRLSERETIRDPLDDLAYDPAQAPELTSAQQAARDAVHKALVRAREGEAVQPVLLHGVTSSGKTEIYLQAVAKALALGRGAIVLVPEIALTPQTVRRFLGRFPGQVGLVHSELSEGERYDTWRRARDGHLSVIVGPRSALFTPLPDIGLIVVDESHDDTYYESNQMPHYHARRVAVAYARLAGALCLLGSATPDITTRYQAEKGRVQLLELPDRILAHRETAQAHQLRLGAALRYREIGGEVNALELPPVEITDMRRELRAGNTSMFSRALRTGLAEVLGQHQQAILFLNRRGTATYVFCRDCGEALRCPNCETPLTLHMEKGAAILPNQGADRKSTVEKGEAVLPNQSADRKSTVEKGEAFLPNQGAESALICHHCGYTRGMPGICPNCGSKRIRQYGTGTQAVEAELQKLFPAARTLRWDYETTRKKGAHALILREFSEQRADVLVGTQMLAKGLDLPLVTLVGVVLADVGLHLPDYRASERVFQVLTQVAGRAGRSPLGGKVVLQTFHPDHYVIQAAARHDYDGFYKRENAERRRLRYPPYAQLVRLLYSHTDARKAQEDAKSMAAQVGKILRAQERRNTDLIGPVPCFYARLNRQYRWQILLRGPDPASALRGLKLVGWHVEVNPPSLL